MSVPEDTIRWLARNASSNVELAHLSNVSKRWREIVIDTILDQAEQSLTDNDGERVASLLLLPSMVRFILSREKLTDNKIEEYCISWFHPDGIEFMQLPLDAMDDSDDEDDDQIMYARDHRGDSPQPFAPSGEQSYAGSEEEGKASRKRRSRSPSALFSAVGAGLRRLDPSTRYVNCMYQWNGYREAIEVLRPFGYSIDFVKRVVSQARSRSEDMVLDADDAASTKVKSRSMHPMDQKSCAVRGATFARPEGYCFCWDNDSNRIEALEALFESKPSMTQWERSQIVRRRNRRRRELQREVLPRVLYSAPFKGDETNQIGVRQPCIQFLNIDSSHAVRLFTPPFKPGPIPTPITVFCVGIATEDGCFISGLRNRFELGHLYPESARDNLIERSAICTCVDVTGSQSFSANDSDEEEAAGNKQGSDDSDDSSCDMSLEASGSDVGLKCKCAFSGLNNFMDEEDDEDNDGRMYQTCRGARGPGLWHCYVAVFDGEDSIIRIDGVPEVVRCKTPKNAAGFAAFLDGLTIGADHTFDMSLCFGNGSDGEGEGAMAELAVFKGAMHTEDIEAVERILMKKHGIPSPQLSPDELNSEDRYTRMAHAMLSHPPRHIAFSSALTRIPLRYMTKHRLVSWRQTNLVTGEPIQVQRIGSKFAESSSEW